MNNIIFFKFYSLAHQSNFIDKFIIFCAEYLPYLIVLGIIFFVAYHYIGEFDLRNPFGVIKKRFREIYLIFTPAILGWIVAAILKEIFASPRPFIKFENLVQPLLLHGGMDSFPSGHATFFGALAVSLFFVNKKVGYLFILFALVIGLARIISGVHFPIDILCGYILGIIIVLIFHYFAKKTK